MSCRAAGSFVTQRTLNFPYVFDFASGLEQSILTRVNARSTSPEFRRLSVKQEEAGKRYSHSRKVKIDGSQQYLPLIPEVQIHPELPYSLFPSGIHQQYRQYPLCSPRFYQLQLHASTRGRKGCNCKSSSQKSNSVSSLATRYQTLIKTHSQ